MSRKHSTTANNETSDKVALIKKHRLELESRIRDAFVDYLQDCRAKIWADTFKADLDQEIKHVAHLLKGRDDRERAP